MALVAVLLLFIGAVVMAQEKPTQWEYKVYVAAHIALIVMAKGESNLEIALNKIACEYWELFSVVSGNSTVTYIFRRPYGLQIPIKQ